MIGNPKVKALLQSWVTPAFREHLRETSKRIRVPMGVLIERAWAAYVEYERRSRSEMFREISNGGDVEVTGQ